MAVSIFFKTILIGCVCGALIMLGSDLTFNPLNPRVKPWVSHSVLTFDSMGRFLRV